MSTINFKFTTKLENKIHENSQQSSVHGPQKLKPHKTFNHEGHEESQRKKPRENIFICGYLREPAFYPLSSDFLGYIVYLSALRCFRFFLKKQPVFISTFFGF